MKTPLFEMRDVTIHYGKNNILSRFNLKIEPGEITAIIGESGSGKTTALRGAACMLGLGGKVTEGNIYYKGSNLLDLTERQRRILYGKEIGVVFQNSEASLCDIRTVGTQIYESIKAHRNITRKQSEELVLPLLEKMGFKDGKKILKSYPFELSGGMNQRIGIMMAIEHTPQLLLADEPTSALDSRGQERVMTELLHLVKQEKMGMMMVTHQVKMVSDIADHLVILHQGKVIESGTVKEIIENPQQEYTKKLLEASFL